MAILNGLFQTKQDIETQSNVDKVYKEEGISYRQWGYIRAGETKGSTSGLEVSLHIIIREIKLKMGKDDDLQNNHRLKIQQDMAILNQNIITKQDESEKKKEALSYEENKIGDYKNELVNIKAHPETIIDEPGSKLSFYIGLVIILFLTVYLFVFYSSASYSAFFKQFEITDVGVANSIFDANALTKAWQDGFTELVLILTIPFVFLGLGFLIHKFQETKKVINYFKAFAFIGITFLFDVILAYGITQKIYNIEKGGSFAEMPDFSPSIAIHNIDFWTIIFSGFIVYIIWGFVFDFIMEAYIKLDKVNLTINRIQDKIAKSKTECKQLKSEIQEINVEIDKYKAEIEEKKLELEKTVFKPETLKLEINNFYSGWIQFLSGLNVDPTPHKQIVDQIILSLNN